MNPVKQLKRLTIQEAFARGDIDEIASTYYEILDRITDWDHSIASIVVAPVKEDGTTNWENAHPVNLTPPSSDSGPEDINEARRWAILIDGIDACAMETSLLLWIDAEDGNPKMEQVSGPSEDGDIAMRIIARDFGGVPPVKEYKLGPLAQSMTELTKKFESLPGAANDNVNPDTGQNEQFPVINPADWQGQPIPRRDWYVDDLIPARNVTLLSGDGGLGKSLVAIQIGVAGALGVETLGIKPKAGKCLYLGAEDEAAEFQRRMADILRHYHCDFEDLGINFRLVPMAGKDATLALPDKSRTMQPTQIMARLIDEATAFKPDLLVLDTSADLFGGDEINRVQVRQFVGMLRQIAIKVDCAVLLLSHPSLSGMQSGTGTSGSTAWHNSVRGRLYLTADKEDPDCRVLTTFKNNYGKMGGDIKMRWHEGLFVVEDGKSSPLSGMLNKRAEKVFVELLSLFNRTGQNVSDVSGTNYAPSKMSKHPDAAGVTKKSLAGAMQRLIDSGEVKIVTDGPPSRPRKKLILASEDYGDE